MKKSEILQKIEPVSVTKFVSDMIDICRDKNKWTSKYFKSLSTDENLLNKNKKKEFQKMFIEDGNQYELFERNNEIELYVGDFKIILSSNNIFTRDYKYKISWEDFYEMIYNNYFNFFNLKIHDAMSVDEIFNLSYEYKFPREYNFYDAIKIITNIQERYCFSGESENIFRVTLSNSENLLENKYIKIIYLDLPSADPVKEIFEKYININKQETQNENILNLKNKIEYYFKEYEKQKNILNYFQKIDLFIDDLREFKNKNKLVEESLVKTQEIKNHKLIIQTNIEDLKVQIEVMNDVYKINLGDETIFQRKRYYPKTNSNKRFIKHLLDINEITEDKIINEYTFHRIRKIIKNKNNLEKILNVVDGQIFNGAIKNLSELNDEELKTILDYYLITNDKSILTNNYKVKGALENSEVIEIVKGYINNGMGINIASKFLTVPKEKQKQAYERYKSIQKYHETGEKDLNYRVAKARQKMREQS